MKYATLAAAAAALMGLAIAEVPQEHSHEQFLRIVNQLLQLDNPDNIQDSVFGLLGNAAAADGAGNIQNLDCLHQATADRAFTNAKAAGDVDGQVAALIFAAVERNTGSVGLKSVLCNETAVNPEITSISQHQDPASDNAAAENKAITLNLAIQIASVGGDPIDALLAGTFAPGQIGDPTAQGNTCNVAEDPVGCIFTQNLLVADASADEIAAAVAAAGNGNAGAAAASNAGAATAAAGNNRAGNNANNNQASAAAAAGNNAATATVNVQSFAGNLGGPAPPVISSASERPFEVNGATFLNQGAAIQRSCAVQKNACANAANSGAIQGGTQACDAQEDDCLAAASLKLIKARKITKIRQAGALDLGSCSDASIIFAEGLDGRKEASFGPANSADFNHGSALNINIISSFICGQLESSCKAGAATVAACKQGQAAANGLSGQAAANAFNSALA